MPRNTNSIIYKGLSCPAVVSRFSISVCLLLSLLIGGCFEPIPNRKIRVTSKPSGATVEIKPVWGTWPSPVCATTPCILPWRERDSKVNVILPGYNTASKTYFSPLPAHIHMELDPIGLSLDSCDLETLPNTEEPSSLAVLDFQIDENLPQGTAQAIADYCRQAVYSSQRFLLVDREQMKDILAEEDFSKVVECDNTRCLVRYGQLLRAQKIIFGRVNRLGKAYSLTIKLIDVETASVEAFQTAKCPGDVEDIVDFIEPITCMLLKDALSHSDD